MLLSSAYLFCMLSSVRRVISQGYYPITGVHVDPRAPGVPYRQSINELQAAGGPQWDLYIQAIAAMHDADADDPLSYFQVAGIHGKPFIEWNGTGQGESDGWGGYCVHGQLLVSHAKRIAEKYPRRYRYDYIQAAETLRAPYWDWAVDNFVPPSTVPGTLQILVPKGEILERAEVDNPLATFKFPKAALGGDYGSFDSENRTKIYRCPSPDQYPDTANDNMGGRPYKEWLYDAFTRSSDFDQFASTGDAGISLEQIHNGIHWDAACGGQFLAAEFSGFDPLFWLHHANVDRLWAYWQIMRPEDAIFNGPYSGGSRFSTKDGTTIRPDSPLQPFYDSSGKSHTTETVKSIEGLGYTYQGLEYWEKSEPEMRHDAKELINRLYFSNNTASARLMRRENGKARYFARVQVDVSEVERPCAITLYLGLREVGNFVVMRQPSQGVIHGGFSLDDAAERAFPSSLLSSVGASMDMIETSLEAEISKYDGELIPLSSVPSLQVEIEHVAVLEEPSVDELPSFGIASVRKVAATERTGSTKRRQR